MASKPFGKNPAMSGHSLVSPASGKGRLEADHRLAVSPWLGVAGAWEMCRCGETDLTPDLTGRLGALTVTVSGYPSISFSKTSLSKSSAFTCLSFPCVK